MTIGLHEKCKERLVEVLTEQLPKATVAHNMFLDRGSAIYMFLADEVIPKTGKIREDLESYVGEFPIFEFVYEVLSKELHEEQTYDSESESLPLNEVNGYENPNEVAERLVSEIDSLPWHYSFTIKFHKELSDSFLPLLTNKIVSDNCSLIQPDDAFEKNFPLTTGSDEKDRSRLGLGLLSILSDQTWEKETLHIQFKNEGFVGYYGVTPTYESATSSLKSFCGLAIALRLLKVNSQYRSTPAKARFLIHKQTGDGWEVQKSQELDAPTSEAFHDLVLHDLDGALDNDAKKAKWVNSRLADIGIVLTHTDKTEKLLLASKWLFESYSGKNELLAFIQLTIVLEILLGDKASSDQTGLSVLLRNRCAYLIGTTQSERNDLLKDFQEIYEVRSKIVHGGKSRITFTDRSLFRKLQWMCRRVIQEEVKLLIEETKKNA